MYYKFVPVNDPDAIRKWQTRLCAQLGLNGRIIVSQHGINGTLGGDKEALECYTWAMDEHESFGGIEYKWSDGGYDDFPKLSVKVRNELVTLEPDEDFNPFDQGTPLKPEEWHEFMKKNPDVTILDARNEYESEVGKFKGAITPKINTFKEIKTELEKLDQDKPLMTYCTGDIRCEYLSAYMKHKGFKEVYHLDGGIVKYGEKFKDDGEWEGKCFVFDRRLNLAFSDKSKDIGRCVHCQDKTSSHINCANKACNKLVLVCGNCEQKAFCSDSCSQKLQKV